MTSNRTTRRRLGLILLVLGLAVIVAGFFLVDGLLTSPLPLQETRILTIERGMSGQEIGQQLKRNGVIDSVRLFRWALWFEGAAKKLKLGTVRLDPPLTMEELIQKLVDKDPLLVRVQIQEGWPSWKIFSVLSRELHLSRARFQELFKDPEFLRRHGISSPTLEGYLFPETYYVSADATPRDVLEQMLEQFRQVQRRIDLKRRSSSVGLSLDEAVRLASIIEREAQIDSERRIISAVYHNRLEQGLPLQADPTVLYPHENFEITITQSMLENPHPYNTYQSRGLPPGAICNPGKASLEASVSPADVPYLYFVAKGDGSHAFSVKLEEHREAVRRFQR